MKLYAHEPGRELVEALSPLMISSFARVEVVAALWGKQRAGELSAVGAQLLTSEFEGDYFGTYDEAPRYVSVGLTAPLLDEAARLAAVHGLRAYDAIQLSSALAARQQAPSCSSIVCFDGALRRAAASERFSLFP